MPDQGIPAPPSNPSASGMLAWARTAPRERRHNGILGLALRFQLRSQVQGWLRRSAAGLLVGVLFGWAGIAPPESVAQLSTAGGDNVPVTCTGAVLNQGPGAGTGYGDSTQNGITLTVQSG